LIRAMVGIILGIFLVLVVGRFVLDEFPTLQPVWATLREHVVALYNVVLVKYGGVTTFLLIIAIFFVLGTSKRF